MRESRRPPGDDANGLEGVLARVLLLYVARGHGERCGGMGLALARQARQMNGLEDKIARLRIDLDGTNPDMTLRGGVGSVYSL